MSKNSFSAVGLSLLLLLGSAPAILLAHEDHEHGKREGGYKEREDSGRYDPRDDDDQGEDEDEDNDTYRSSSKRYPPPDGKHSAPREYRDRAY